MSGSRAHTCNPAPGLWLISRTHPGLHPICEVLHFLLHAHLWPQSWSLLLGTAGLLLPETCGWFPWFSVLVLMVAFRSCDGHHAGSRV